MKRITPYLTFCLVLLLSSFVCGEPQTENQQFQDACKAAHLLNTVGIPSRIVIDGDYRICCEYVIGTDIWCYCDEGGTKLENIFEINTPYLIDPAELKLTIDNSRTDFILNGCMIYAIDSLVVHIQNPKVEWIKLLVCSFKDGRSHAVVVFKKNETVYLQSNGEEPIPMNKLGNGEGIDALTFAKYGNYPKPVSAFFVLAYFRSDQIN